MFKKLPIALLVLFGACAAHAQSHTLTQLQGTSRVLMVFAPEADSAKFQRQLELIAHHSFELSLRNTVVVPVATNVSLAADYYGGESLPVTSLTEQSFVRTRFHIQLNDFAVVLLNEDGAEQARYTTPVDIHELTARLDALTAR